MIFESDLDVFFDDDFAEPAYVGTNEINVIFDLNQEVMTDYNVIGYKPMMEVKNSDIELHTIEEDTEIEIRNKAYRVSYIQDNGFNTSKVVLERQ